MKNSFSMSREPREFRGSREINSSVMLGNSPIWEQPQWSIPDLIAHKNGRSIAVVLPALNEEATVGGVVASVMPLLGNLVDELWVVDSGSTDATIRCAQRAGAQVITREDAVPGIEPVSGKGEVLWRSLGVVSADIVVFMDSDVLNPDPSFVPKLVGPLINYPELKLCKAFYQRPLMQLNNEGVDYFPHGGGRVTELAVRPLLAALMPEVSTIIQPLSGEYAATREHLVSIPFAPGYGVEIGIILDTVNRYGISAIGQVNLGIRSHRNRTLHELGAMSRQVISALLTRCHIADSGAPLVQFVQEGYSLTSITTPVMMHDRPPFSEIENRQLTYPATQISDSIVAVKRK